MDVESAACQLSQPREDDSLCHRWAVILAGGDGTRLLPFTRGITGDDRPKQFCAILGEETLLEQTRRRVSPLVPTSRTLLMLTGIHQRFYADQVAGLPDSSVVIQPSNRGTAPAILYSLARLHAMDPAGVAAFFPSDHYFSDDEAFVREIDSAYRIAARQPGAVILVGIHPETLNYGWIEPGAPIGNRQPGPFRPVKRFWEKPHLKLAMNMKLMKRGCLWNTFVMVGKIRAFLNLVRRAVPRLVESFEAIRPSLFTASETEAVRRLYSTIPTTGFSQDVLQKRPRELAVLCASGLGWSDLGEPNRVLLARERVNLTASGQSGVAKELEWAAAASHS